MKTLSQDGKALDRIRKTFDLSENDLATLLGVQRQSVTGWREHGVPSSRRASVERLGDLARVLHKEVIPSRIPQIVRTPDAWLGGRTILETIRIDGPEAVYGYLARLFNYNAT
jgi:DNA-binding XRE family transcriptional regulator